MGILNNKGELIRDPQFPELPTILAVYTSLEGRKPTGDHWNNLFSLFSVAFGVQKFWWYLNHPLKILLIVIILPLKKCSPIRNINK